MKKYILLLMFLLAAAVFIISYPRSQTVQNTFPQPSQSSVLLDLGVTDGQTRLVNLPEAAADGIMRYNIYIGWVDLEPSVGTYDFSMLDSVVNEAAANNMRVALKIQITEETCTSSSHTDDFCIIKLLPPDLSFSRRSSRFDNDQFVTRLSNLVNAIMRRYDSRVLTHVYVGNEVNSYINAIKEDINIDKFPEFLNLIRRIYENINTLPQPRPKFGTVLAFYPTHHDHVSQMSRVGDVIGLTLYPTDPDFDETDNYIERTKRWLNDVRRVTGGRPVAITEIGHQSSPPPSDASAAAQTEFARTIINYYRQNQRAFEYVVWFSMYDNPNYAGRFFGTTGLKTIQDEKKPVYDIWARQSG